MNLEMCWACRTQPILYFLQIHDPVLPPPQWSGVAKTGRQEDATVMNSFAVMYS